MSVSKEKLFKLADAFKEEVKKANPLIELNYKQEAHKLSMLAGKINYQGGKEVNSEKAKQLKDVGNMLLEISDVLKFM